LAQVSLRISVRNIANYLRFTLRLIGCKTPYGDNLLESYVKESAKQVSGPEDARALVNMTLRSI